MLFKKRIQSADEWRSQQGWREFEDEVKAGMDVSWRYFVGIDLGKLNDRTVISVIESETRLGRTQTAVRALEILPLGMSYTKQAAAIANILSPPRYSLWPTKVFLDASGLGQPVADILKDEHELKFSRVTITSGNGRNGLNISRNWLINNLYKYLSAGKLLVSTDCPNAALLRDELEAMRLEFGGDGAERYIAGGHDDAIMATALAAAGLERAGAIRSGATNYWLTE